MSTRILITDDSGQPLWAYSNINASACAAWEAAMRARHAAAGEPVLSFEWLPSRGGDDDRSTIEQIGRHRVELRTRPDGQREIVGALARGVAAVPGTLRLLHAPADVVGMRYSVRVPNGRHHAPLLSAADARIARRQARAQARGRA